MQQEFYSTGLRILSVERFVGSQDKRQSTFAKATVDEESKKLRIRQLAETKSRLGGNKKSR